MTEDQRKKVDELLDVESGLRGKEIDFLDSLTEDYTQRELSDRQSDWLDRIYDRMFPS